MVCGGCFLSSPVKEAVVSSSTEHCVVHCTAATTDPPCRWAFWTVPASCGTGAKPHMCSPPADLESSG